MSILTSTAGSAVLLVIGIALFIFLCYKNVHTGIAAIAASIIVALGTADGVAVTIFETFAGGVGTLVSTMFFLFTAAGLLG
ncbi:MAG: GntP family permease, partial [Clostridiales bacterium]|nr:GntP family permease [Clostridiales bacterium]